MKEMIDEIDSAVNKNEAVSVLNDKSRQVAED